MSASPQPTPTTGAAEARAVGDQATIDVGTSSPDPALGEAYLHTRLAEVVTRQMYRHPHGQRRQ